MQKGIFVCENFDAQQSIQVGCSCQRSVGYIGIKSVMMVIFSLTRSLLFVLVVYCISQAVQKACDFMGTEVLLWG